MAKKSAYKPPSFKSLCTEMLRIECDDLGNYIETMNSGLKSEVNHFEERIEKEIAGKDDERRGEVLDWFADEAFGLMGRFPALFWQSAHISLWALFEQEMNFLCRKLRARTKKPPTKEVIFPKGHIHLPAEKCLLEFGFHLPVKSPLWRRMKIYLGIRNLIVHNRGELRKAGDDESDRVRAYVRRVRYISIEKNGRLLLTKEFCEQFLKTMRSVLLKTYGAVPKKWLEHERLAPVKAPGVK